MKYFICNSNGFKKMYQVMSEGSKYNPTCKRCIVAPMNHDADGNLVAHKITRIPLVFSKLKGFVTKISDEEIWDIMGLHNASFSERNKRMKDFTEHRNYFDDPNNAEYETWHESGDTVLSSKIWTPCDHIPSDLL